MGLMRRLVTSSDGKITFPEFAKLIRPIDLRPYLRRIRKYTKEEKKQIEVVKQQNFAAKLRQARTDLRKPLTAFIASEVMLNRDPERHIKLMPARYFHKNELDESGPIAAFSSKFYSKKAAAQNGEGSATPYCETLQEETDCIGKETKQL